MDDRLADIKARAEAVTADPWVYSDCDGTLRIWRERALTYVTRDENGEISSFSEPASYKTSDLIIDIDLEGETWDPGEDAGDDQRRADIDAMVTARQDDVPWLVEQLEQARRIAVELENENARLASTDPWQRAVDGLNALVDAGIGFWIEPDGHISNPLGDEHIEYDREAERWRLAHDDEETPNV